MKINIKYLISCVCVFFLFSPSYASATQILPAKPSASVCKNLNKKIIPKIQLAYGDNMNLNDPANARIAMNTWGDLSKIWASSRSKTKGEMRVLYRDASKLTGQISKRFYRVAQLHVLNQNLAIKDELTEIALLEQDFIFTLSDIYTECGMTANFMN